MLETWFLTVPSAVASTSAISRLETDAVVARGQLAGAGAQRDPDVARTAMADREGAQEAALTADLTRPPRGE